MQHDTVTVIGGKPDASRALSLYIPTGKTIDWQAEYVGNLAYSVLTWAANINLYGGTVSGGIEGRYVTVDGGTVEALGDISAIRALDIGSHIIVKDGVVRAAGETAICIYNEGITVEVLGGAVTSDTEAAIVSYYWESVITVSGGAVSGKYGIYANTYSYDTIITIDGGVVSSQNGVTIVTVGEDTSVTVNDGRVESDNIAILTGGENSSITINGGTVNTTGNATSVNCIAIYASGADSNVTVTGGTVSVSGHMPDCGNVAIYLERDNSTVTVSGGLVSASGDNIAYNNAAVYSKLSNSTADVSGGVLFSMSSDYTDVIDNAGVTVTNGNAVIISWSGIAGASYNVGDTTALGWLPASGATVTWALDDGAPGIYYENGSNTGFLPIAGITVTLPTPPPTGTITIGANSWNTFWSTVTFGLLCKNTQAATISASGDSGAVMIQYYLSASELSVAQVQALTSEWQTYSGGIALSPNNKYIVYAKLSDSYHTVYINSAGIALYTDSAAVTASIGFIKGSTVDVTANVTLNGNTIKKIMNGPATLTSGTDYTVSGGVITFKAGYLDGLAASATPYTLTITYNPQGVEYPTPPLVGSVVPATTVIALTVSKAAQAAPAAFTLRYTNVNDTSYTVTIPAVSGAEYSFDGATWSNVNTKTGCLPGDTVTGYMRMAAITGYNASPAVSASVTLPLFTEKTPTANPAGGGTTIPDQTPVTSYSNVIIDGNGVNAGEVKTNGDTTTATVNQELINVLLKTATSNMTIVVPAETGKAVAELVLKNVEDMAAKDMTLTVLVGNIQYEIPATSIDTAAILTALRAENTADVPISITITTDMSAAAQAAVKAAIASGAELVIPPMEFKITATCNGQLAEIDAFGQYVTRSVEITAAQAANITTAIMVDPDGTTRHVPTRVYQSGGKWYAEVNSLTNSIYAFVHNEKTFADARGKWYESAVNEMGSRMIISGVGSNSFAGERDITRAEFAAIIVRALGLPSTGNGAVFYDIPRSAWYCGAVGTAYEYGLVSGVGNNRFAPGQKITRQEAMLMIQRAAKIAELTGSTGNINAFSDAGNVSAWALDAALWNVGSGVVIGSNGKLRPLDNITRAETATLVLKLLQKTGLVDVRTPLTAQATNTAELIAI